MSQEKLDTIDGTPYAETEAQGDSKLDSQDAGQSTIAASEGDSSSQSQEMAAMGDPEKQRPDDSAEQQHFQGGAYLENSTTIEQRETSTLDIPDGGLKAWLVVAGGWICTFMTFGYLNAFGVFQAYYLEILPQYSSSDIAWVASALGYFFIFVMGLPCGRLFDMGLFKPVIGFGMLLLVFCQMMLSLSTQYYQILLAQGIGLGMAFGIVFSLSVAVPAQWFLKNRGAAFGVLASGSSMGGVIFPIMCQQLIPKIGFPWTMRLIGFIALVLLIGAWLVLHTRLPPSINIRNGGWKHVKWIDVSALRDPAYASFVFGATLVLFGLYTPFTYMDVFTAQYHLPANGYYLCILNAASLFGRVLPGFIADKYGRINMVTPHLFICAILILLFPLCTNLAGAVIFSLIFGYCSGCYVSLLPACVAQLGPTSNIGTRLGMMFASMSIGGLLGTPISGYILGTGEDLHWWPTLVFAGVMAFAGSCFIFLARQLALRSKQKPDQRTKWSWIFRISGKI